MYVMTSQALSDLQDTVYSSIPWRTGNNIQKTISYESHGIHWLIGFEFLLHKSWEETFSLFLVVANDFLCFGEQEAFFGLSKKSNFEKKTFIRCKFM